MIEFPPNPVEGAKYSGAGKAWIWNGAAWKQDLTAYRGVAPAKNNSREIFTLVDGNSQPVIKPVKTSYI